MTLKCVYILYIWLCESGTRKMAQWVNAYLSRIKIYIQIPRTHVKPGICSSLCLQSQHSYSEIRGGNRRLPKAVCQLAQFTQQWITDSLRHTWAPTFTSVNIYIHMYSPTHRHKDFKCVNYMAYELYPNNAVQNNINIHHKVMLIAIT